MVIVLGEFAFEPADVKPAAELMRVMTQATVQEAGCLHYAFASDLRDPQRFQLSELWQDDAALDAHATTPHMAVFRAGLARLRVQYRSVRRYTASESGEL